MHISFMIKSNLSESLISDIEGIMLSSIQHTAQRHEIKYFVSFMDTEMKGQVKEFFQYVPHIT